MSQNRKLTSLVSSLALLAVAGVFAAACGDEGGPGGSADCATVGARIDALQASADVVTEVAADIKGTVVGACAQIAGVSAPANPDDQQVTSICNDAKAKLDAALTGSVSIVIVPPACSVNAEAQLNCEADCYAEANVTCDPGELEARCDPGELSVQCNGTCEVNAECQGSAELAVECEGTCSGVCEGSCSGTCKGTCEGTCQGNTASGGDCNGTCQGTCNGECTATCEGSCRGTCKITAEAGIECSGEARCKGGCDGDFTAPKCEANLTPPSCEGSAAVDCSADCEGSASLEAECTEASVEIVGMADAQLKADLEAALPKLLEVTGKANLGLQAVGDLGSNMVDVSGDAAGCALTLGANVVSGFSAAATAAASATASVSVSFSASASVTGSATGGAG